MPFSMVSGSSVSKYSSGSFMSTSTSPLGRFQFSEEKAKRVSHSMPRSWAARTTRRTESTPARWPSLRGSPRLSAQRPLPSMITATWRGILSGRIRGDMAQTWRISSSLAAIISSILLTWASVRSWTVFSARCFSSAGTAPSPSRSLSMPSAPRRASRTPIL